MTELSYGFSKKLSNVSFDDVVARVTEALKAEGFGVLTTIDVRDTLKKKIDVDFEPYVILGACNPKLAHQALEAEPNIGLLLPCNVVVRQCGPGEVEVSMLDPKVMFSLVDNPKVAPLAEDVYARLARIMSAVVG